MKKRRYLRRAFTGGSHKTCVTAKGGTVRTAIAFFLLVTLVIPCRLFSEVDSPSHRDLACPHAAHYGGSVSSDDLLAMGSNPPDQSPPQGSSLCTCWACSWDQRVYCNSPESHPEYCKKLTFSCYGPSPEDCCKK